MLRSQHSNRKDFDLESYMGIWYKLSSYDLSIEPAKPDIERMLLTLQDDGTVLIEDPGLREENGQCSQLPFIGRARPLENNNAVWQVKLPDEPSRIIRVVSTNYIDFSIVHTCAHVTPGNVCPEDQIVIDYYSRSSTELASDRISYETMQYILSDACFDPYFDGMEYRNILKEPCSENTWRPVVNEVDFPPVANTGPKRVVAISRSYVLLDGSQSSDDNEIVSYEWAKDVGGSADMEGIRTNKLRVYNLEKDVYVFTLTVTDNAGQVDRSQVTVSVESESKRKSPKDKSLYKLDRPKIDDKTPVKTEKCDMCKMAVQELDTLLESNKDAIKNFVESMCDRIPDPHGSQCHQEVEENFDMIIEMLESTILKPDTLCTSIGFCQTTTVEDIMNEYAVY
ncbi:dyslexia-associated protein KIAA0319-like protein [Saccoglossus kowalevskii]|uniref:Uncharacterized protein LOC102802655 n=1 Tax=Saccoglossus kowalevskii TaxID=10224 RepID=A0ABM0M4T0_SACKO|nr:PREDICTED: uncharacterized protein LOC102802655 [Saccoglossus kowalevskii]